MSFKTLAELQQMQEEAAARRAQGDRPKATWLSSRLKNDRDSVKFRILQELHEGADGYDEARGLGKIVMEHNSPWLPGSPSKHARCTMEESGECYGCERALGPEEKAYTWKAKPKIYVNVLVAPINDKDDPEVMIASWSANSDVVKFLLEHSQDYGTLLNVPFKITRSGQKTDTTYITMPVMSDALLAKLPLEGVDLYDLDQYIIHVPYERQAAFYGGSADDGSTEKAYHNVVSQAVKDLPKATDSDIW